MSLRPSSSAAQRFHAYLEGVRLALEASHLFEDVRVQLDPFQLEDVMKENFKTPAARIFILKMDPDAQASSAQDVQVTLGLVVIARREGRPDLKLASADLSAMGLLMDMAGLIQSDPYFGLAQITAAKIEAYRVAVSEKSNPNGLALTLLQLSSTLLRLIPDWPAASAVLHPARPAQAGITGNGDILVETGL